jgi:GNAT superfamily N-acetyltransferase
VRLTIMPLEEKHLDDAALLVAGRYKLLRYGIAELPTRYENASVLLSLLANLTPHAPGVVALRSGQLVGFLTAWLIPDLRGQRSVYSPEWANGARTPDEPRIYQDMYAALSAQWVAARYCEHLVTLFASDSAAVAGWQQMGFGHVVMDAIRDVSPLPCEVASVDVRRATIADLPQALALRRGLRQHVSSAPTFLADALHADADEFETWLGDSANALWLACREGRTVASLGIGPASQNACTVIRDEGTASIISAFTIPEARGGGAATALLARALDWAHSEGFARCAVDFETANLLAMRFWPRFFKPVCHSLGRHVNERITLLDAHAA